MAYEMYENIVLRDKYQFLKKRVFEIITLQKPSRTPRRKCGSGDTLREENVDRVYLKYIRRIEEYKVNLT